jgi:hypothetical protein
VSRWPFWAMEAARPGCRMRISGRTRMGNGNGWCSIFGRNAKGASVGSIHLSYQFKHGKA